MNQSPADQPQVGLAAGDPVQWLELHGDALFGFAMRRVQRHDVAEDLVQETLLAGMRSLEAFDQRSSIRTWLTGILKNKIVDHFRREVARETRERREHPESIDHGEPLFARNGQWLKRLSHWSTNPSDNMERTEFWEVFENCLGKLPVMLRAVFVLREMDGEQTESVCDQLGISKSNVAIRLYRARLNLRTCIEQNWFRTK